MPLHLPISVPPRQVPSFLLPFVITIIALITFFPQLITAVRATRTPQPPLMLAVHDINIHFHALDDLFPVLRREILQQQQHNAYNTHNLQKLLRAECLYDYLLTNNHPSHCTPQIKDNSSFNNIDLQQSGVDVNIPMFESHPLLIPLQNTPTTQSLSLTSTLDTLQQPEHLTRQKEELFLTTTTLPPFGEKITMSFSLAQPPASIYNNSVNDSGATHQDILQTVLGEDNADFFHFELLYNSPSITSNTRVKVIDNSNSTYFHTDSDSRPKGDQIISIYGAKGSTYSGEIVAPNGDKSILSLTIIDRGNIEAVLFHRNHTIILQPPKEVIDTYKRLDTWQKLQQNSINNGRNTTNATDNVHHKVNQAIIQTIETLSSFTTDLHAQSQENTKPTTLQIDSIINVFQTLYTPLSEEIESNHITITDLQYVSSLFFQPILARHPTQPRFDTMSTIPQILSSSSPPLPVIATILTAEERNLFNCATEGDTHHHLLQSDGSSTDTDYLTINPLELTPHLTRWTNCVKIDKKFDNTDRRFHYGMVVDYGAFVALGSSIGAVLGRVQATVAYGNNFYPQQVGLTLTLDEIIIFTSYNPSTDPPFNNNGFSKVTESQLLSYVSNYKKQYYPTRLGVLGLVTTLFSPPGIVGLAYLGQIGLSSSAYWANLNFYHGMINNHELSHCFSATHTFNPGEGSVMSYDLSGRMGPTDAENINQVGLHSRLTRPQVCGYLSQVLAGIQPLSGGGSRVPLSAVFSTINKDVEWNNNSNSIFSTCGNGIVEGVEECDMGVLNGVPHTTSGKICCSIDCKLTPSSTCAPFVKNGAFVESECCKECAAQYDVPCGGTRQANRIAGVCSANANCVTHGCYAIKGLVPCSAQPFDPENSCMWQCQALNQTNSNTCYPISYPQSYTYKPLGSHCTLPASQQQPQLDKSDAAIGICISQGLSRLDTFLRPYESANYHDPQYPPQCVPRSYNLVVTDSSHFQPCGCNGYSLKRLSCLENNINYVDLDTCLFHHKIPFPLEGSVKCVPPPYCQL